MMGDIQSLVIRNDLGLEPEKVQELRTLIQKGSISFLSPEKESTPYMLFFCGDSLESIALKTNYPFDIILLTAVRYNWPAKAAEMKKSMVDGDLQHIKTDIIKMLLIATHTSMQKSLADVLSGRGDAKDNQMIPKNIKGLKDLLDMVDSLGAKAEGQGGINVTGGNIQINLQTNQNNDKVVQDVEVLLDIPKSKIPKDL